MKERVLIAHGGGPTPVINNSLRGVIEACKHSDQVEALYAARYGIEGVFNDDFIDLTKLSQKQIDNLAHTPATAIGSCRRKVQADDYERILEVLAKHEITIFLYNGGNDSMDTCNKIFEMAKANNLDLKVIGIPKTIDNDLAVTDHCPGFGSAARYAGVAAAELALDATGLPIHVIVMEIMGRNAGWLTAASSLAGKITNCEQIVLLPEVPFEEEKFLEEVLNRFAKGKGLLVTVSEGLKKPDGSMFGDSGIKDGFGHTIPGGAAEAISQLIIKNTDLKSRAEKPGLLGRTSIPYASPVDQDEAFEVGKHAIELALQGVSGKMVTIDASREGSYSWQAGEVDLNQVANVEKKFPLEWITDDGMGIREEFWAYCLPLLGEDIPEFSLIL